MRNANIQPTYNNEVGLVQHLFQELKDEGYINLERQLVIVENGDCYFTKPIHKKIIFFNKNCPIPRDMRLLALILLHEEGHKKYSQFQSVYTYWILLPLFAFFITGFLTIFLFDLLWIITNSKSFQNTNILYTIPIYLVIWLFLWLLIKHFYSKKYMRYDEIHADIYGAIGIKKKYNELKPSLITKASFEYFNTLRDTRKTPKNQIIRLLFQLWGIVKKIDYKIDDSVPSHDERIEIIRSLIDTD